MQEAMQHAIPGWRACPTAHETSLQVPEPTSLQQIVQAAPSCYFEPFQFFVSWQGVLTLAYR